MKKASVFVLVLTLISSIFTVYAFAVESSEEISIDLSKDISAETSNDVSIPTIGGSATESTEEPSSEEASLENSSSEEAEISEEESSEEKNGVVDFDFSVKRIPVALKHMAVGMIGVLIVLSLIAIVVCILNSVFKQRQLKK